MKNVSMKSLSALIFIFLLFLVSCNDDKIDFTSNDSENVQDEAATDGYFEDADDMATLAVAADDATAGSGRIGSSGRIAGVKPIDIRFSDCVTVTLELAEGSTQQNPHGYITIDFGSACTDIKGNVRSGIIHVEFIGRRFYPESKIVTTFENYKINGVQIEGTRTVTNVTDSVEAHPKFSILIEGGKATWPDGSFATREANRTREWIRAENPLLDQWNVDGTAAGTNRRGVAYQVEITKPLVYKRECAISNRVFMAVEGTKVLTTESKTITIDYGTGECDKTVTITKNGVTKTIEVKGNI